MRALFFVVLLAGCCGPQRCAAAYFVQGTTLADWIAAYDRVSTEVASDDDVHDATLLAGYIQGVIDAGDGRLFCLTRALDLQQVLVLTRTYIEQHREQTKLPAAVLIGVALFGPFPCARKLQTPGSRSSGPIDQRPARTPMPVSTSP